jgi:DNA-binding NarL/FixJ family response regulator
MALIEKRVQAGQTEVVTEPSTEEEERPAKGEVLDLMALLGDHPRLLVVGEAADGEEAVALAASLKPDVVIIDVNMPKMDGVEAARRIKQNLPATVVIGLSMHDSGQHEETMMESAASAYLTKDSACSRLPETIFRCQAAATAGPLPLPGAAAVHSGFPLLE